MLLKNVVHALVEVIFVDVINEIAKDLDVFREGVFFQLNDAFGFSGYKIDFFQGRYSFWFIACIKPCFFQICNKFVFPAFEVVIEDWEWTYTQTFPGENDRRIIDMIKNKKWII